MRSNYIIRVKKNISPLEKISQLITLLNWEEEFIANPNLSRCSDANMKEETGSKRI